MKLATIIIPHHKAHDHLKNLLSCLDNSIFDIVICSGGSCGYNYNKGAKVAETDKMLFMNDDVLPRNEDLIRMCDALDDTDMVGSTQISLNKNKKYYGIAIEGFTPKQQELPNRSMFLHGFCLGTKRSVWDRLKGFNEGFLTGYEDVDLGIRAVQMQCSMRLLDLEIKHVDAGSEGRFDHVKHNCRLLDKMYPRDKMRQWLQSAKIIQEV